MKKLLGTANYYDPGGNELYEGSWGYDKYPNRLQLIYPPEYAPVGIHEMSDLNPYINYHPNTQSTPKRSNHGPPVALYSGLAPH